MIICLYGEDSKRRIDKANEILLSYRKKKEQIDIKNIDLEELEESWKDARDFLNQPSIFEESKILFVKEACLVENSEWIKTLKTNLQTEKTFVLISLGKKPGVKFSFLIKKPALFQEFKELQGAELEKHIIKESKNKNVYFEKDAFKFFVSYVLSFEKWRSWISFFEIEKLSFLKTQKPIKLGDLKNYLNFYAKDGIYNLSKNLLFSNDKWKRLVFLEKLLLQKESPSHIFNLIAMNSDFNSAKKLAESDVLIKSGKLDYEEALLDFSIK